MIFIEKNWSIISIVLIMVIFSIFLYIPHRYPQKISKLFDKVKELEKRFEKNK
ncbi:hypothetical protein SAMN05661008_00766 [Alkalithermobacter thermoalcaliphilus JW-YL-7 = DSM 7308]|uniref:Uncharacterized protein n=1 Tax=Alkalithermobacter thermoalcaliphilus JW-YL-7 = DSM 7308 TaxID=1121328 RepID=A0A150FSG1_CLOPD|nr:hypothetical protein JWYL7_1611 [[Clostridium] paradoxum JW-YL-7 = DSM 7308]SHK71497.1 hypothetical protein SAMN05661008_00766 [[Clostridium] paradoxum JW-YL-7 = DSM 7308]